METINRVLDLFPPQQAKEVRTSFAGALRGIVSQRLVTKADGKGRVPAVEVLVNTGRVFDRLVDPDQTDSIVDVIAEGGFYGMQSFDQALVGLVKDGLITTDEARRTATSPHDFDLLLSGVLDRGSAFDDPPTRPDCPSSLRAAAGAHGYPRHVDDPGTLGATVLAVPPVAKELGARFADAGYELYLVGGSVRDLLRGASDRRSRLRHVGAPHRDHEGAARLGGPAVPDRRAFGTVGALKDGVPIEITTFRKEVYAEEHRKPAVTFGDDVAVDLSRRDFTINAMALRLPDGEFLDPYGGVKALAAGALDTPLDPEVSFSDDPLRMIRAARFVVAAGRAPRPTGWSRRCARWASASRSSRPNGSAPSSTSCSSASTCAAGLELLVETGLAERFLPELPALSLEQDPVHRHKDVLRHTYAVVERCEPDADAAAGGAAARHRQARDAPGDAGGRDVSPPRGGGRAHGARPDGARCAIRRATIDDVCTLIELHLRFHGYGEGEGWTDAAVRRYVRDAGPLLDRLNQLTRADVTTRNERRAAAFAEMQDDLEERIAALAEQENLEALRPPLDGRQVMEVLGLEPGPAVGEALAYLMELRMERGSSSEEEATELLRAWAAGAD